MMDRVILHCDLNSFYASVELLEHPELCNRPVAVCGDPESRHGIILAKNEPAKKYKVQTAETIWQARRKCPDLVLLPAHHWKYRAYSGKVNRIYERYTDLVEPFSIDESWLDVTGTLHLFGGNGKALADEIRRVVREELGLTLSVGVSFNKVFAKMGSDYKKPDATTLITRENFQQLLWPLPVTDLLFVGKAAANVLNGYGIRTIGDLARFDRDSLGRILGKGGYTLHDYATGREHAPVLPAREMPGPKSVGNGLTYANTTATIPRPLLDRMEVIELTSYTDEEKLQIARQYLLPKQMKEHGIAKTALRVSDDAIRATISGYTKESGVRTLERTLGKLCRKAAMRLVSKAVKRVSITEDNLEEFLGVRRFLPPVLDKDPVGVVNGLAWTKVGGELLEVEVNVMEGSGKLELTGNLGDVMKESAHAAISCIRSRAAQLGIDPEFYKTKDIHIHFPEGAVPKDGPSAGVAITTAVVSALTGVRVRSDVAMTGEVTLRGRVLAIGGLKEKTMAAKRNGIRTVIIPRDNQRDLEEIDPVVREALRFVPAETVDTVLAEALLRTEIMDNREETKSETEGIVTAFVPPEPAVKDSSLRQ